MSEGEQEICACEKVSHGDLGPVKGNERVARVVASPRHLDKHGNIKPSVFPPSHVKEKGLSLVRVDKIDAGELQKQATNVAETISGDTLHGVLVAATDQIRAVVGQDGVRSLCLVDDPLPDNDAHAYSIRSLDQADPEIERLRGVLMDIFGSLRQVSDVYE